MVSKNYIEQALPVVNPDEIKIRDNLTELDTVKLAISRRKELLSQNEDFVIETTLLGNAERRRYLDGV